MTDLSQEYYALLGFISQMPKEEQDKINDYVAKVEAMRAEAPEETKIALSLVWLKEQMEALSTT